MVFVRRIIDTYIVASSDQAQKEAERRKCVIVRIMAVKVKEKGRLGDRRFWVKKRVEIADAHRMLKDW